MKEPVLKNPLLMSIVRKDRDIFEDSERNGVYYIPLKTEDRSDSGSVGMTKRKMKTRRNEHLRHIAQGKSSSALAKLNLSENICIDFDDMRILHPYTNKLETMIRESVEIAYGNNTACNSELSYFLPGIWKKFFGSSKKVKPVMNQDQQTTTASETLFDPTKTNRIDGIRLSCS